MESKKKVVLAPILAMLSLVIFLAVLKPTKASHPPLPLLVPGNPVTNPVSNTHTASATTSVSITYDEAINPATVSTQTFAMHAMQTGLLTQTYSVNTGEIKLTPNQPFKAGELVQVSATTGTLNLSGQGPISPTVWQYQIKVINSTGIFENSNQFLGTGASGIIDVALGDVDGDGDLDAFVGNLGDAGIGYQDEVWLNDGSGNFSDSGQDLFGPPADTVGVALGDVDNDGDLDAYVANIYGTPNFVWLNNGLGTFTDSGQRLGNFQSNDVALGDVDGDGDLDAFTANGNGTGQANKLWINDGLGNFADSGQNLGNSWSRAVALGDVDGDGDLDALVGNNLFLGGSEANRVWLNDGLGTFTDSGQLLGSSNTLALALGDMDGDGDLDVLTGNTDSHPTKVWLNNGGGIFSDSGQNLGNTGTRVALGDIDGDGDLDALSDANIWTNNGAGVFSNSGQSLGSGSGVINAVALGDVNGDGDLDAFIGFYSDPNEIWLNRDLFIVTASSPIGNGSVITQNGIISTTFNWPLNTSTVTSHTFTVRGQQSGVYDGVYQFGSVQFEATNSFRPGEEIVVNLSSEIKNANGVSLMPYAWQLRAAVISGTGTFINSGQSLGVADSQNVALADVDKDGDIDAFVTNNGANKVWKNDGAGTFSDTGQNMGVSVSNDVKLGDLDEDGDLDAFVANGASSMGQANEVWLNNGTGTFVFGGQDLGSSVSNGVALADVDGDGDLDAFIANNGANKVWLNDGASNFSDSNQSLGSSVSYEAVLADIDGDGDLDAFVANCCALNNANRVWLNDGTGNFSDSGQFLGSSVSRAVVLGDVNGDGDLDALVGNSLGLGQANKLWLNDGTGIFNDSGQNLGMANTHAVALNDVDGDGDLDALFGNLEANEIWLNDGSGNFTISGQNPGDLVSFGTAFGDVDGDGDIDAFVGNGQGQANEVWLNGNVTGSQAGIQTVYLPIIIKPDPTAQTDLHIVSINTGGVNVEIRDPNNGDITLLSCTAGNNTTVPCGNFPSVGTYKIIAITNKCGTIEGIFNDAIGGSVTRSVYCYN